MSEHQIRQRLTRKLGELVTPVTRAALRNRSQAEIQIMQHWNQIVGPVLSRVTSPEQLRFPPEQRRDGTLTIRTVAGWGTELQHFSATICETITLYLGYPAVAHLRIRQDYQFRPKPSLDTIVEPPSLPPEKQEALTQRLASVPDEKIRLALEKLGKTVALHSK